MKNTQKNALHSMAGQNAIQNRGNICRARREGAQHMAQQIIARATAVGILYRKGEIPFILRKSIPGVPSGCICL